MSYTVLEECPDLRVYRSYGVGHWTNANAETFTDESGKAIHIHFYLPRDKARVMWKQIRYLLPNTIESVSFSE